MPQTLRGAYVSDAYAAAAAAALNVDYSTSKLQYNASHVETCMYVQCWRCAAAAAAAGQVLLLLLLTTMNPC